MLLEPNYAINKHSEKHSQTNALMWIYVACCKGKITFQAHKLNFAHIKWFGKSQNVESSKKHG
jgi:hypothetical protein